MRVLFLLRSDTDRLIGGTAEQLRQYAQAVTERGGTPVLHVAHTPPSGRFDIAHVFNVDWPLEGAHHMDAALACADRVVLSPVHHRRAWEVAYHAAGRDGTSARVASVVGLDGFLRLRGVAQAARTPLLWREAATQLATGIARRQRDMLTRAERWLVASPGETASIVEDFGLPPHPTTVIRNGGAWIDDDVPIPPLPEDFVLCVARVEARKNQLGLARALVELGVPGHFVGPPNPRHRAYVERFATYVDEQPLLTWQPWTDRRVILGLFRRARLHALASWYEVAALVDSEAAVAGCPIVTTSRSHSRDVLGDAALYWDPASGHAGLVEVVRAALERPLDRSSAEAFQQELSWERVRADMAHVYGLEAAASATAEGVPCPAT